MDYAEKRERLLNEFRAARPAGAVGISKRHSNLFRDRAPARNKIDARGFNRVISVDADAQLASVEGMTTYDDLVRATLPHGLMPAVVPELKTITVGGALAGIGIEASSFRHGLAHEAVTAFEVMLGDGRIITCSATEHADLFRGFPNSYGTLGYALRLTVRLVPVRPFVRITRRRYDGARSFFADLAACCAAAEYDFIDGVIFGPREMYLNLGQFTARAPAVSDYTWLHIYYRSFREKSEDHLTVADFLWRWDSDWFWCSRHFGMEFFPLRLLLGRFMLNSYAYWKVKRWAARCGLGARRDEEAIVQDIGFPAARAAEFLEFFAREIAITPLWVCPFVTHAPATLFPVTPGQLYVDLAFWDSKPAMPQDGHYNRLIERQAAALQGVKSLYSTSYYDRETFAQLYGGTAYCELKNKYDPGRSFPDLYDKCILRH